MSLNWDIIVAVTFFSSSSLFLFIIGFFFGPKFLLTSVNFLKALPLSTMESRSAHLFKARVNSYFMENENHQKFLQANSNSEEHKDVNRARLKSLRGLSHLPVHSIMNFVKIYCRVKSHLHLSLAIDIFIGLNIG